MDNELLIRYTKKKTPHTAGSFSLGLVFIYRRLSLLIHRSRDKYP